MDFDEDSESKVGGFLRSLFRYKQMTEKNAPEGLISAEKNIMKDRLDSLSVEEVYTAVISWTKYEEEQSVMDEIEDEKIAKDLDAYILTLN